MVLFCVMTYFLGDVADCGDNCIKCDVNGPDMCDTDQCETGYALDTNDNACQRTVYHSLVTIATPVNVRISTYVYHSLVTIATPVNVRISFTGYHSNTCQRTYINVRISFTGYHSNTCQRTYINHWLP